MTVVSTEQGGDSEPMKTVPYLSHEAKCRIVDNEKHSMSSRKSCFWLVGCKSGHGIHAPSRYQLISGLSVLHRMVFFSFLPSFVMIGSVFSIVGCWESRRFLHVSVARELNVYSVLVNQKRPATVELGPGCDRCDQSMCQCRGWVDFPLSWPIFRAGRTT